MDNGGLPKLADDGRPFTTLGYNNGPGSYASGPNVTRPDLTDVATGMVTWSVKNASNLNGCFNNKNYLK